MQETHLLICHSLEPKAKEYLQDHFNTMSNLIVFYHPTITSETSITKEIKKKLQSAEILMGYNFPLKWLQLAENVKLIISPFAGVKPLVKKIQQLQKENSRFKNLILTNSHGNARFVAQHAMSLLFSLTGQIFHHHEQMKHGIWHFKEENKESMPLFDKQIGLLGYGAINQHVHQFLSGFPVKFNVLKNSWKNSENGSNLAIWKKFTPPDLKEFLKTSDVVIMALPLTDETKGMIGLEELTILGKNAFLINLARGPILQEKSLYTALKEKRIRGAAIDVWYDYSPKPNEQGQKYPYTYPFHELDNIILSPHRADSPFDDLSRWDDIFINIEKFLCNDKDYVNRVNLSKEY